MSCTVTLHNGQTFALRDSAYKVAPAINQARGKGKLIELENCRIPTGQMSHFDPDQVSSVVDDR